MRSNAVWTVSLVAMAIVAVAAGRGRADTFQVESIWRYGSKRTYRSKISNVAAVKPE